MHSTTTIETHPPLATAPVVETPAVCWGAIIAGALAAAVLSLILLLLGTGFGFSLVSPWSGEGISATTFGVTTILWVTIISFIASAVGGYLAGRLRTRWNATHSDEVYFRDTAHGFLAWALSTLITVTLLTTAITGIVAGGVKAGATLTGGAVAGAGVAAQEEGESLAGGSDYLWDSLFRRDQATNRADAADPASARLEAARIFIKAVADDNLPEADARYLARVIAAHTDVNQQEAERRVRDTWTRLQEAEGAAKEAADTAATATAYASLWLFISLLIGAFIASYAATFGGRQRDSAVRY